MFSKNKNHAGSFAQACTYVVMLELRDRSFAVAGHCFGMVFQPLCVIVTLNYVNSNDWLRCTLSSVADTSAHYGLLFT